MLDKVILKNAVTKDETRDAIKPAIKLLGERLSVLQQKLRESKIPVIIVFEGWGASGKGSQIGKMILNLDPRGFEVITTNEPSEEDERFPFLNKFWLKVPQRGEIAIFDKSWYHDYLETKKDNINTFERQLTDDGYLIVKFFLHIDGKEQKNRLDELSAKKNSAWRVNDYDLQQNKHYNKFYKKFDAMLEDTNTDNAPWNAISGMDKNVALYSILGILVKNIEEKLNAKLEVKKAKQTGIIASKMQFPLMKMPKLADVDLSCTLEEDDYNIQLEYLQNKLQKLSYKLYKKSIPLIICYEGCDAAGKGGNIKRVVESLDPRDYDVSPISAPDSREAAHHYLWRFRNDIPKTGHIKIFDRTWYGRVMVERVEGFCSKEEWKRAYNEINEFEKELTDWGAIVVKFWLQIDKDEQLARFTQRQETPEKQWKITDEDWRNREKWDKYEVAINDMLKYTSTVDVPWTIVESNSKHFARIKTLETIIEAIEMRI